MKNKIYLTEEGKKEIEESILELKKPIAHHDGVYVSDVQIAEYELLEKLLESAIILPFEKSWEEVEFCYEYALEDLQGKYKNGVIIQPKQ